MFRSRPAHFSTLGLIALFALSFAATAWSKPYEETEKKHSWLSLSKPAKNTPAEQLQYATRLEEKGRLKKASRHYRALAITWPSSREAAPAQLAYARLLLARGKDLKAFDAYQHLMERYFGQFAYDEVLETQFRLAERILNKRKGKFLMFGGFQAPERAIPLFEKVIANGPQSVWAPQAQYLIGQAYEMNDELELAVVAYMTAQHRYPLSDIAEEAAFGRARCLYRLTEENPNDEEALDQAWAGVVLFMNVYPKSDKLELAQAYKDSLYRRRALAAYNKAIFYDRIARKPEAALMSYQSFVKLFPNSEWTSLAQLRIDALSNTVKPETSHEN